MAKTKDRRKAASLRKALEDQGRTVAWLARATGYSRGYVSNILGGNVPWTEGFQRQAMEAMKTSAAVPVTFRGRVITVPEDIYRNAAGFPLIVVESVYEEAWKRAWLQEHAASTLAAAAERAWLTETAVPAPEDDDDDLLAAA